jgi:elongation factor 1-beta
MGSYVIRLKVLPQDTTTEHQKIVESVAKALPAGSEIKGQRIEPIAFGLSAIVLDIITPEEDGIVDKVEHSISNAPLVGQYELMGVSRMSSRLHTS